MSSLEGERRNVWVDGPGEGEEMVLEGSLLDHPSASTVDEDKPPTQTDSKLVDHLREEAYYWPKIITPPLKRSKHVILDSCTPEGVFPPSFSSFFSPNLTF